MSTMDNNCETYRLDEDCNVSLISRIATRPPNPRQYTSRRKAQLNATEGPPPPKQTIYQCITCPKSFHNLAALDRHEHEEHFGADEEEAEEQQPSCSRGSQLDANAVAETARPEDTTVQIKFEKPLWDEEQEEQEQQEVVVPDQPPPHFQWVGVKQEPMEAGEDGGGLVILEVARIKHDMMSMDEMPRIKQEVEYGQNLELPATIKQEVGDEVAMEMADVKQEVDDGEMVSLWAYEEEQEDTDWPPEVKQEPVETPEMVVKMEDCDDCIVLSSDAESEHEQIKHEPLDIVDDQQPQLDKTVGEEEKSDTESAAEVADHVCKPFHVYPRHFLMRYIKRVYSSGYTVVPVKLLNGNQNRYNNTFRCNFCAKIFTKCSVIAKHLEEHDVRLSKRFKAVYESNECRLCDKLQVDVRYLQRHLMQDHKQELKTAAKLNKMSTRIKCFECGTTFPKQASNRCVSVCCKKKDDSCPACEVNGDCRRHPNHTKFSTKYALSHYPCTRCTQVFRLPNQLALHVLKYHEHGQGHTCTECGEEFGTIFSLGTHRRNEHSSNPSVMARSTKPKPEPTPKYVGRPEVRCEVCFETFMTLPELHKHRTEQHLKCFFCKRSLPSAKALLEHQRQCMRPEKA